MSNRPVALSPEAAGVLVAAMEYNARATGWAEAQVRESLERDRDFWRDRALEAEKRLDRIGERLFSLID